MTLSPQDWRSIRKISRQKLGHQHLRPGQQEALDSVLSGRDTLAVLPTGSGKSAIYQIAALMLPGPTVVISPLIALQVDQVESIAESHLGSAALVNSTLMASERRDAFECLEEEDLEFLLLAPEQLSNAETFERVRRAEPSLFVVDEAHCISEWGHDFRPDYLRLGAIIDALGHPRTLALTATANPEVRTEIIARLHLRDPEVIVTGFDRPNIHLSVRKVAGERLKRELMVEQVVAAAKPGIIYTATRKHAEELAGALSARGIQAVSYHAGLKREERSRRQAAFMGGEAEVITATNAFGMGIDKPDVRFVYHYDVSDSLDAYYQEIGRAGRDGKPAEAVLFYSPADLNLRRFMASGGKLQREDVERVASVLNQHDSAIALKALAKEAGISQAKVARAIARLEEQEAVERLPTGEVEHLREDIDLDRAAEEASQAQEARRDSEQRRVEQMRMLAELHTCRRAFLLQHFGEAFEPPCDNCDNCDRQHAAPIAEAPRPTDERALVPPAPSSNEHPFPPSTRVVHKSLGSGTVRGYEGEARQHIVVDFDEVGDRRLAMEVVEKHGLLEKE